MESQPESSELKTNPENFHLWVEENLLQNYMMQIRAHILGNCFTCFLLKIYCGFIKNYHTNFNERNLDSTMYTTSAVAKW